MNIFSKNEPFEFGEALYKDGGKYGPVKHGHLDLFVLFKGQSIVNADGKIYTFNEGEAGLIYNERLLDVDFPRGMCSHIIWCHTGELFLAKEVIESIKALPKKLQPSSRLVRFIKDGINLGHEHGINIDRLRNSIGESAFNEYFYRAHLIGEEQPLPEPVLKTRQYIEKHFPDKCNRDSLADMVQLNPRYLSRLYQKHLGITPVQYLWQVRSEAAIRLLCKSGLSISEIAYQCGFQNPYHFSQHIKKHYGHPPRELRKRKWIRDPETIDKNKVDIRF